MHDGNPDPNNYYVLYSDCIRFESKKISDCLNHFKKSYSFYSFCILEHKGIFRVYRFNKGKFKLIYKGK